MGIKSTTMRYEQAGPKEAKGGLVYALTSEKVGNTACVLQLSGKVCRIPFCDGLTTKCVAGAIGGILFYCGINLAQSRFFPMNIYTG